MAEDYRSSLLLNLIIPFYSGQKKHFRVQRLQHCLELLPGVDQGMERMRAALAPEAIGKSDVDRFFEVVQELLAGASYEDIERVRHRLGLEITRFPGVAGIDEKAIYFDELVQPEFRNRLLCGSGEASFFVRAFRLACERGQNAQLIEEILRKLDERGEHLQRMQERELDPEWLRRKELHSEMVVKESWGILNDVRRVLEHRPLEDSRQAAERHLDQGLQVLTRELTKVSDFLSDKLVFIIRAKYTKNLPVPAREVVARSLRKLGRIFASKMTFFSRMLDNPHLRARGGMRELLEHVELTMLYAVQTLPHGDVFANPTQRGLAGTLRAFALYANLIYDIEPYDRYHEQFSAAPDLTLRYLPPVAGQSVSDLVRLLEGIACDARVGPAILRRLCDHLMQDVESYLQKSPPSIQDRSAALTLKKWVVHRALLNRAEAALSHLDAIRAAIERYQGFSSGRGFYLPGDLTALLREVCCSFGMLLGEEQLLGPLYAGDDRVRLLHRQRGPSAAMLRRSGGAILRGAHASVGERMRELLRFFAVVCDQARQHARTDDFARFEALIRHELELLGFAGSIVMALQDEDLIEKLMRSPWIKNQSWNRNVVVTIVEICRALALPLDAPALGENL